MIHSAMEISGASCLVLLGIRSGEGGLLAPDTVLSSSSSAGGCLTSVSSIHHTISIFAFDRVIDLTGC